MALNESKIKLSTFDRMCQIFIQESLGRLVRPRSQALADFAYSFPGRLQATLAQEA